MARLATSGNASCAFVAIGGIKNRNAPIQDNEEYLADKAHYELYPDPDERSDLSADDFYERVLYPTDQRLGETRDMPLSMILDDIEKHEMADKYLSVVLNEQQLYTHDFYWPKLLNSRGFKLVHKTNNEIGVPNYLFVRNNLWMEIQEDCLQFT